jgi:uncharacterized protein with HEPN domain
MSKARDLQRVTDVLFSIEKIETFITGISLKEFESNFILQAAIQYHFLIIGEAVGSISMQRLEKYDYPWHIPKSFRNFIIHEYHAIKMERIYWATKDMEDLKSVCLQMKTELS